MDQLVTTAQAASMLGFTSTARVRQLIEEGHLEEAGRAGRVILLRRADVERLAREGWPGRRQPPPG
jgi:Helix-turn-helix domain